MSKKIILFLSDYKEGAKEQSYHCPQGELVTGAQTWEAPVKYLLQTYPDVSAVLCVVTPAAQSALPELKQRVAAQAPKVEIIAVPFDEQTEDFNTSPLSQIMASVEKGDEILLETTGGLRDAIMHLLLVSRVLSYTGIPTAGAVYSNFGSKRIVDCSHLIGLFDLVGGMQELAGFGSVSALRKYYAKQGRPEPEISALLNAMERLKADITLCRTEKLPQRIDTFNKALEQAENCSDPLMRALLPAFQTKFGKKLNVPGLIKWCIESDMVQQALTIYKERIPGYILEREILIVKENAAPVEKEPYEVESEVRFRQLLGRRRLEKPEKFWDRTDYQKNDRVTWMRLQEILMDYAYIRMLRNHINHASKEETSTEMERIDFLTSSLTFKRPDQATVEDIKRALTTGLEHLKF